MVEMLIMRGARINVMNRGDDTPLHLAASHGHRDIVQKVFMNPSLSPTSHICLEVTIIYCRKYMYSSPSSNATSYLGLTVPSASFCLSGHWHQLLQYKADINAVNEHGNVPLHYACFWGQDQVAEVSTQALSPGLSGKQSLSLSGRFWNPQSIL